MIAFRLLGRAARAIGRGLRRLGAAAIAANRCPHARPGEPVCYDCWLDRQW